MPAARVAKRGWENVSGALFFAIVFAATSILLTVHAVWPVARALFGVGGAVALAGAAWGITRIPRELRTWSAVPRRGVITSAVTGAIVVGGIAYGLHDYLGTTFAVGHECRSDRECRSSHCFDGVCTDLCNSDADCPEHMICTLGRSVLVIGAVSGSAEDTHFCTVGVRAAPP